MPFSFNYRIKRFKAGIGFRAMAYLFPDQKTGNMNRDTNKIRLLGNLGRSPDIKTFQNGNKLARLTMSTQSCYKDEKGKKITQRHWHTVVVHGRLAEVVEGDILRGSELTVEGELISRSYIDKTGANRVVTEVEASAVLPGPCGDRKIPAPGFE